MSAEEDAEALRRVEELRRHETRLLHAELLEVRASRDGIRAAFHECERERDEALELAAYHRAKCAALRGERREMQRQLAQLQEAKQ